MMSLSKNFTRRFAALALAGGLWLAQTGPAAAQPLPAGGHRPAGGHISYLTERLSLTSQQQAQIREIFERHREKARAERQAFEASLSREQRAEMETRRKEWQARHEERTAQREGRPEGRDEPRSERKERPLRSDGPPGSGPTARLTPEQRETFRARRQAERRSIDGEIRAVLTPEQAAEFDRINAERPQRPPGDRLKP